MERRHQVRPEPHLVRDLLHEPDVAIETIDVRTLVCRTTALPAIALKLIYFAEVPPFGKDQPGVTGIEKCNKSGNQSAT